MPHRRISLQVYIKSLQEHLYKRGRERQREREIRERESVNACIPRALWTAPAHGGASATLSHILTCINSFQEYLRDGERGREREIRERERESVVLLVEGGEGGCAGGGLSTGSSKLQKQIDSTFFIIAM